MTRALIGTVGASTQVVRSSRTRSAATSSTDNVAQNVLATPLSLTAGTWDVSGSVAFLPNGSGQNITFMEGAVSLTSATMPDISTQFAPSNAGEVRLRQSLSNINIIPGDVLGVDIPTYRVTLSSSTTLYLVSLADHNTFWFVYGWLEARKVI
jgi:hypothetical protein